MELYPHNQQAYNAVMEAFKTSNRAAVVHATGSGKSYIIAAVANNFNKVILIAPNNFVLDQTRAVCHGGVEFRTYASVMFDENPDSDYDLIVLDEFHRSGAEKWGEGVKNLIERNPQAKLLGTSATHIRYADKMRNMADEMFDGNVVSHLTAKEAINRSILPMPKYVSSIYSIDADIKERIIKARKNKKKLPDLEKRIKKFAFNWNLSNGVSNVIRKYVSPETKRVIVFCNTTDNATEARQMLSKWFNDAGWTNLQLYNIDYTRDNVRQVMRDFVAPSAIGALKIAITVNMLNEGIHIDGVDCIVMLRSTMSRIIIEQQIGRCLTADNVNREPVILDLVNNIDAIDYTSRQHDGLGDDNPKVQEQEDEEEFPFSIIDECRDVRDFFEEIDTLLNNYRHFTKEECAAVALKYKSRSEWKHNPDDCHTYQCAYRHGWIPEITQHMGPMRKSYTYDEILSAAKEFDTLVEFSDANPNMYSQSRKKGWTERLIKEANLKCKRKTEVFTLEYCKEVASQYKKRKALANNDGSVYDYIRKNGWENECFAHMGITNPDDVTNDELREAALKFTTRKAMRLGDFFHYNLIVKRGLESELFAHFPQKANFTKEEIIELAKPYRTKSEFQSNHRSAFNFAKKNGWLDEVCANMAPPRRVLNEQVILVESAKYKTSTEFKDADAPAYRWASEHNLLEQLFPDYKKLNTWNRDTVLEEAKKYDCITHFARYGHGAMGFARKHNMLDEIRQLYQSA